MKHLEARQARQDWIAEILTGIVVAIVFTAILLAICE